MALNVIMKMKIINVINVMAIIMAMSMNNVNE